MKSVNIYLSEPQIAALKALSKKTNQPYAELIRRAVDQHLIDEKQEPKRSWLDVSIEGPVEGYTDPAPFSWLFRIVAQRSDGQIFHEYVLIGYPHVDDIHKNQEFLTSKLQEGLTKLKTWLGYEDTMKEKTGHGLN